EYHLHFAQQVPQPGMCWLNMSQPLEEPRAEGVQDGKCKQPCPNQLNESRRHTVVKNGRCIFIPAAIIRDCCASCTLSQGQKVKLSQALQHYISCLRLASMNISSSPSN